MSSCFPRGVFSVLHSPGSCWHSYSLEGTLLWPQRRIESAALSISELEEIRGQATQFDWTAEVCPDSSEKDLDHDALTVAKRNLQTNNAIVTLLKMLHDGIFTLSLIRLDLPETEK